jgi:hypothetical protein
VGNTGATFVRLPIGNTVENSRGFDRLASDAMEKSLANGGLATIASMTKKTNLGARALKGPAAF